MAACGSRRWARNWADLECTKMHWRQSGTPGADAFAAKASQAINSVLSILRISKRADGRSNEVWGWGVVISFRISEAVRCAEWSRNAGRWPVNSDGRRGCFLQEGTEKSFPRRIGSEDRSRHRGHRARSKFTEKDLEGSEFFTGGR